MKKNRQMSLEQLEKQRVNVVKQLEEMVRKKAPIGEFRKVENYLKMIDRRIERKEEEGMKKT